MKSKKQAVICAYVGFCLLSFILAVSIITLVYFSRDSYWYETAELMGSGEIINAYRHPISPTEITCSMVFMVIFAVVGGIIFAVAFRTLYDNFIDFEYQKSFELSKIGFKNSIIVLVSGIVFMIIGIVFAAVYIETFIAAVWAVVLVFSSLPLICVGSYALIKSQSNKNKSTSIDTNEESW